MVHWEWPYGGRSDLAGMVLTADGSVANPRPGIAAAATVRASLAVLEGGDLQERDQSPSTAALALWRLLRCATDEGLGISAGLSLSGADGGMADRAIFAACGALERWFDEFDVCWAACELLRELIGCFHGGRLIALEIGAADRVARALLRHHRTARRRRAEMQGRGDGRPFPQIGLAGCQALRALLQQHRDGGRTAAHVADSHGAQAVVDTLVAASVMEEEVAAVALSTLVDMLPPGEHGGAGLSSPDGIKGGSVVARRAVLRSGAIDAAVGAMRGLTNSRAVQEQGVRFLGTIVSMGDAVSRESAAIAVARAGGITVILALLLGHPRTNPLDGRCSTTHYFGIWALHAIACYDHGQPAAQGRAGRVLLRQAVSRLLTQVGATEGGVGRSEHEGGVSELLAVREKHSANRTLVKWCTELLDIVDEMLGERRELTKLQVVAAQGRRGPMVAAGVGAGAPDFDEIDMQASLRALQTMSFDGVLAEDGPQG